MRARSVSDTDIALLRTLAREPSVVAASRRVGISRDRATYRLARLGEAFGGPVVASVRGGRGHGGTRLTPLGDRIVREGFDSVELLDARPVAAAFRPNLIQGTYRRAPNPEVEVGGGVRLRVAFAAEEGELVSLLLDPESVLIARGKFASSARNVVRAKVESVTANPDGLGSTLLVRAGSLRWKVAMTDEPVHQLHLVPGAQVWLYVKATALRRVIRSAEPGPRPSRRPPASRRGS